MFDSAAVEVAVGLIFVYFLFSLVCSKVNEYVAGALRWRARGLEGALCKLLDSPAGGAALDAHRFFEHPTIKALVEPANRRPVLTWAMRRERTLARVPSYLSSETFATVVTGLLGNKPAQFTEGVKALPPDHPLKQPLEDMVERAGTELDKVRASLERYYDQAMDRVSGWYKRRVQKFLALYAVVVALLFNVDTIAIATTMWTQPTVRASVVELAKTAEEDVDVDETAAEIRDEVGLPLGWELHDWPWEVDGDWGLVGRVLLRLAGLAITVLALTLGAPFWFDTLSKVSQLRSTGKKPAFAA